VEGGEGHGRKGEGGRGKKKRGRGKKRRDRRGKGPSPGIPGRRGVSLRLAAEFCMTV